ncbi:MAG: capsular exopolysaccharide family [Deltaproteobacteria bacterium]|nr:capsular exopolysaccharide family [Deltaproteobacteria bacterium]
MDRISSVLEKTDPQFLVALQDSVAAEQFRKLRTQIFLHPSRPHSLLVTSAEPMEGKSLVALNLAVAISKEFHKKTILIEADMRKPSLFLPGRNNAKGLSDYLSNQTRVEEVLVRFNSENLSIIPAGLPSVKASELIGLKKMEELITSLRDHGEDTYIIIDSPPLLSTSEALLLSMMVEGIIFVVMADKTPRESAQRALRLIDRKKIVAIVLNQAQLRSSSYYYHTIEKSGL